jgi:HEAT repeat protein
MVEEMLAAEPAVPALIEALADPDAEVRRWATWSLGQIRPAAVPVFTAGLADPDPDARYEG